MLIAPTTIRLDKELSVDCTNHIQWDKELSIDYAETTVQWNKELSVDCTNHSTVGHRVNC